MNYKLVILELYWCLEDTLKHTVGTLTLQYYVNFILFLMHVTLIS